MKKSTILVFLIALLITLTACRGKIAEPINLPELSDIESIKITQDSLIFETTDSNWISELVEQINTGKPTIKQSIQDVPNVAEYTEIDFILKNNRITTTLFVYEEKDKLYVEQPYQGIYLTDDKLIKMIIELEEVKPDIMPSNEAEAIGITLENYPKIDGSTSTLPLVQGIYRSMFQSVSNNTGELQGFPQQASKTINSYELLISGEVDLILVPDPSQDIVSKVEESGIELEYIPIGAEALVFITHEDNPAQSITKEQVQEVYSSMTISNWSQLGGIDGRIVPICRNADAGSQAQIENLVLDGKLIAPEIEENYMERDMNGMLQMVEEYGYFANENEKNAYAIGYTMYYYMNLAESVMGEIYVKPLAFNGVTPLPETILSKEYPLATNYYAVIRKNTPEEHSARKIANWLISTEGQWQVAISGLGALEPLY